MKGFSSSNLNVMAVLAPVHLPSLALLALPLSRLHLHLLHVISLP